MLSFAFDGFLDTGISFSILFKTLVFIFAVLRFLVAGRGCVEVTCSCVGYFDQSPIRDIRRDNPAAEVTRY